jgi:hypothetical protein
LLEDMAASIVTLVKIDRIARLKRLHHFGEIALRGLQDKVDMLCEAPSYVKFSASHL